MRENMELYMNQSQLFKLWFHGMECYQIWMCGCLSLENYEYEMNKFTPEWRKNVAGFFKKRIVDICGKVQLKDS